MSTKSLVVILAISGLVLLGSVFVSSFSVNQPLLGGTILFPTGGGTGSSTLSGIIMGNGTGAVNSVTIGTGLSLTGTTLISTASGNWATSTQNYYESQLGTWKVVSASFLTPTTTLGVLVGASSTIGNGTTAGGLTINGGATTTLTALFQSPVGINCAPNKGAYGGSGIFTICGDASNAAILELSRPISSGASNIFSIAFGDTSNSVLGQINGRSDTSGSTGKWQFLTSNGSNDLQALTIDSSQNAAFSNSGTSTFSKGLEIGAPIAATYFIATSTATSTAANGWNLTGGCFAINGTCVGGSGGSGTVTNVSVDSTLIGGPITTTGTLGINLNNANQWNNFVNIAASTGWYMLGSSTLAYASSTNSTTIFGLGAGGNTATSSGSVNYETAIGWQALSLQTTGNGNTAVGAFALSLASTSPQNTAVGVGALWGSGSNTFSATGQNTAVGYFALASSTVGNNNTALGYNAGRKLTTGVQNVFVGAGVGGANAFTGSGNTFVGFNSGVNAFSESNNTFIGNTAGGSVFNGSASGGNNTFVGSLAGSAGSTGAKQFNTVMGGSAGNVLGVNANDNTIVGYKAGALQTTGIDNVLVGSLAGQALTTASNNILIGYNTNSTSTTGNNFLNIGNLIFGSLPATTSASTLQLPTYGTVGIGTSTPWAEFSISANNGMNFPSGMLFVIASSTGSATSTLFSVTKDGFFDMFAPVNPSSASLLRIHSADNSQFEFTRDGFMTLRLKAQDTKDRITYHSLAGSNDNPLYFDSDESGTTRVAFLGTGQVGIASTTPYRTLSVEGTMAVNGLTTFALNDSAICFRTGGTITVDAGVSSCIVSSKFVKNYQRDDSYAAAWGRLQQVKIIEFKYKESNKDDIGAFAEDMAFIDLRYAQYAQSPRDEAGHHFEIGDAVAINWSAVQADEIVVLQHVVTTQMANGARSAEENWQWAVTVLLFGLIAWQQDQIRRFKKVV